MTMQPRPRGTFSLAALALSGLLALGGAVLHAQTDTGGAAEPGGPSSSEPGAGPQAAPAPASGNSADAGQPPGDGAENAAPGKKPAALNLLNLLLRGGLLMIPIVCLSALVVTVSIERAMGLRRDRVIPDGLVHRLGQMGGPKSGFDPRQAYRLCQQFPSAAARVIRVMLLKVGRPHAEVEHAVQEASEREADRLYANVRWLTLAAAVAPLLGLFGTVWGMIRAFHDFTLLAPGLNKADYLAEGIFVALVTTLSGLAVAIPAAVLAHYFESRIHSHFHEINELLFNLLPQVERFEGRVRFSRGAEEGNGSAAPEPPPSSETPPASPPPTSEPAASGPSGSAAASRFGQQQQ